MLYRAGRGPWDMMDSCVRKNRPPPSVQSIVSAVSMTVLKTGAVSALFGHSSGDKKRHDKLPHTSCKPQGSFYWCQKQIILCSMITRAQKREGAGRGDPLFHFHHLLCCRRCRPEASTPKYQLVGGWEFQIRLSPQKSGWTIQPLSGCAITGFIVFYSIPTRMSRGISIFTPRPRWKSGCKVYLTYFGVRKAHLWEHRSNLGKVWTFKSNSMLFLKWFSTRIIVQLMELRKFAGSTFIKSF